MKQLAEAPSGADLKEYGSILDALAYWAETTPDALAVETSDHGRLTYAQLLDDAHSLARGFLSLGLKVGDRVAIQLPSSPEFIVTYMACKMTGCVLTTLHMPYRQEELRPLMSFAEPRAVVTARVGRYDAPATMMALSREIPSLEHVIVVGEPAGGQVGFADLVATHRNGDLPARPPLDCDAALCFTSGTSGTSAAPKGVLRSQRCFARNASVFAGLLSMTAKDRVLIAPPLTHVFGLSCAGNAIHSGATIVPIPIFSPEVYAEYLFEMRPTVVYSAPAHLAATLKSGEMDRRSAETVRNVIVGGAICPPDIAARFEARLPNGRVGCLYGMTEMTLSTQTDPAASAAIRHGTVGKAAPGMTARVVHRETGEVLPAGAEGELQFSGYTVLKGYVGAHEANQSAFAEDGWFRTGDIASLDAEGNIMITGRVKDVINRGGIKINPSDIESLLDGHEAIVQSAVVSMPDEILGERLCAYVVLRPGTELSLAEVCDYLARCKVAKMRWPERLEILDAMPMTPTRKIIKPVLIADIRKKLGQD
ncbi:fatty-acyl-CoA synthase [Paracoccus aminovorans]|uniref:Fatty-acyl-CoA synthase n=1 Tax=Paracoccus aminovorans TaxID=34004 RepID=A0A1I3B4W9_9RHOB|nr:class I adenylate-forming enzyme family protein [Paracoccus aminovorans]CQR87572.1 Cyclohexanecarboxylate-CoA ligase [Paracoccus aminovorans]SFH56761.1 fatty-acyl-CoA synthase [Paracoccus aminovorans]